MAGTTNLIDKLKPLGQQKEESRLTTNGRSDKDDEGDQQE